MKYVFIFFVSSAFFSCNRKITKKPILHVKDQVVHNAAKDTSVKVLYDTLNKTVNFNDVAGKDTILFLEKYFEKNIISPLNTGSAAYKSFIEKVSNLSGNVKTKLFHLLRNDTSEINNLNCPSVLPLKSKLAGSGIVDCVLEPIPLYYLSANAASFKKGNAITDFFNLDTTQIYFGVYLKSHLLGVVRCGLKTTSFRVDCFYPQDSMGIKRITDLGKNVFAVKRTIVNKGGRFDSFGYISANRLFLSFCTLDDLILSSDTNKGYEKQLVDINCTIASADNYYLQEISPGYTRLRKYVMAAYQSRQYQ